MRLVSKRIENARNRVQPKGRDTVKVGPEVWQWLKERQYEATKRGEKITQGDIILGLIKNAKGVPQLNVVPIDRSEEDSKVLKWLYSPKCDESLRRFIRTQAGLSENTPQSSKEE